MGPRSTVTTDGDAADVTDSRAEPPALFVEGITKQFGSGEDAVLAVEGVDLRIERGSVVGLLGPNGAGKTTLLKCALGMVLPDEGTVRVFGTEATGGNRAAYADVDAMLEGARNDYWRLTVMENLRYFATISGIDPDSVADHHERLLERLDLTEKANTPVRDLSRGMKQKVSLASVLAGGAELVVLDEPTLGLDIESSRTLREELRRLAHDEGYTIVVSSHDMTTIEAVCDRVVVMSDGRIVADGPVESLLDRIDRDAVRITSDDIDDALVEDLASTFDVQRLDPAGGRPRIEVSAAGDDLYDLMDRLRAADVTIDRVSTVEPDLEDAFVAVTDDAEGDT